MTALLVVAGAALGAPLRWLAARRWDRPDGLAWGTLGVNLLGSLLLGAVTALDPADHVLALVGVGFCGALTTFSAFASQVVRGGRRRGAALTALTIPPAVGLCALGYLSVAALR